MKTSIYVNDINDSIKIEIWNRRINRNDERFHFNRKHLNE